MDPRTPVFLGARSDGGVYLAESFAGGYSVWREDDFMASFGFTDTGGITTCGAGSDPNFVGCTQNPNKLSVDDLRPAGSSSATNFTATLTHGGAVTNYRDQSNALVWLIASDGPVFTRLVQGADAGTSSNSGLMNSVQEAATTSDQAVWLSGSSMAGVPVLMRLDRTASVPTVELLATTSVSGRVHVATNGEQVVAGWVDANQNLNLAMRGAWTGRTVYALGGSGWTLVDLAMSGESVVAVLTATTTKFALVHRAEGAVAFDITNQNPLVIHLGQKLSIAGFCTSTCSASANPVDQWNARPDGGLW